MNLIDKLFIFPVTELKNDNESLFNTWIVLVVVIFAYYLLNLVKNKKGGDMAKTSYTTGKYDVDDVYLNIQPTKHQLEKIEDLCKVRDFEFATYFQKDNSFYFSYLKDYEALVSFFKKLINIVSGIDTTVKVVDKEDDVYWILIIKDDEIEECFGTVWWNTKEEKQKITEVLKARLKAEDDVIESITEQISNAIVGEYDSLEETEEDEE